MPSQYSPLPEDDRSSSPAHSSNEHPFNETDEAIDFDQAFRETEQSLLLLKARHAQIRVDQHRQQDLQQRKSQIEKQLQHPVSQTAHRELKRELKQIRQRLEELEVSLESQLFSWSGLKEVFWQAVRFGGLGVIVGWILKSLVG